MLYLEILGTIAGIISVYLATSVNKLTWILGILSTILLGVLFFNTELYSSMLLQVFFFIVSIVGYFSWSGGGFYNTKHIDTFVLTLISIFITALTLSGMNMLGVGEIQHVDAFTVSFAIVATILLVAKDIRAWGFYIVSNIASVWVCIESGLYYVVLQYLVFITLSIIGYIRWKKLT